MQQHGSKYFACRPHPLTLGMGPKGQNSTFSEHGHVAYQIKCNPDDKTWLQIFCSQIPLQNPGDWVYRSKSTFSEHGHVAYQLNGIKKCSLMVANILPADTPLNLGVKLPKFNFFRTVSCCISNVREPRIQQHGSKYFASRPPPPPKHLRWGILVKNQLFLNMVTLHYSEINQIKWNHEM